MNPLSKKQIAVLVQLARNAFTHVAAKASARGEVFDTSAAAFDQWRHDRVRRACGAPGLRGRCNDDYLKVMAQFQADLDEDGKAMNTLLRAQDEPRRQAEALLVREMDAAGFSAAYADSICLSTFKCHVLDASAEQLRKLMFTVRNRARAKCRAAQSPALAQ